MAKKKNDNTLQYLQMPLPEGRRYSKMTKVAFGGLNKRITIDSGELSAAMDISTSEYPYITPSKRWSNFKTGYSNPNSNPIGLFGFDDFLIVIYRVNSAIKIDYITEDEYGNVKDVYTGTLKVLTKSENETDDDFDKRCEAEDDIPRSVVQFNHYGESIDIVNGAYVKKLLIFPDKMSMDFEITSDFTPESIPHDSMPNIKYATVHLSRLFGVSDDAVYVSGFNDYTNWKFDSVGDDEDTGYNENNAWMSQTQSNTKADGKFTGIINYQGHIVCFKRDYMHEIYNTKNPFRIVDVYAEGTIDNRSIQDVDGKLIFVSDDNVKIYTGSNPRIIGHNLNMSKCTYAVSGTDNRNYYLYCQFDSSHALYVYDTYTELWSQHSSVYWNTRVLSFAHNKCGMYRLDGDGVVRKYDTNLYSTLWYFETDLITNKTVDIKHIKKLQMLVEVAKNAKLKVYILYDDERFNKDTSHLVYSCEKYSDDSKLPIRVKPRKTANYGFKLHVEGSGYVKLYELEIFVESGGDLYV